MKTQQLKDKSKEELINLLREKTEELVQLNFSKSNFQLKNYRKPGQVRKDIARIKTLLNRPNAK
jgi:large subunit ribosomal protein L29